MTTPRSKFRTAATQSNQRMWVLPATLMLLHIAHLCSVKCDTSNLTNSTLDFERGNNGTQGPENASSKSISIAIVISIFAVFIVASVAYCLIRKMKKGTMFGQDKRVSSASDATHGQPRYLSHSGPQEPGTGHHVNYENVFIDKPQEAGGGSDDHRSQRQSKSRLPSSIEKAKNPLTEQPIYANTQDVYYNFPGKTVSEPLDEEVYIMPDQ